MNDKEELEELKRQNKCLSIAVDKAIDRLNISRKTIKELRDKNSEIYFPVQWFNDYMRLKRIVYKRKRLILKLIQKLRGIR